MKQILRQLFRLPRRFVRRFLPRRIRRMALIPIGIVLIGTCSYPLIEGPPWTLFDGLYMTVITLTTVGYGEIPLPLSKTGRSFTMFLALGGIFLLFYIATDIIRSVITGELGELLGKEHMDETLKHLNGHTIVCGFGRMGKIVCDELERMPQRFVVIESTNVNAPWPYQQGILLQGDAAEEDVLRRAGIERARALITVVGSDASNLYITLSARLLKPSLVIVARAEEEAAEAKLIKVGASKVISPYLSGGHRAVQAVFKPKIQRFMDLTTRSGAIDLQMEELLVEPGSRLAGQLIRDTQLSRELNIIVVGIIRPTGDVINTPHGDARINAGDILILIGSLRMLEEAQKLVTAPI